MITLLTGENSFEVERKLAELAARFDGAVERFDGAELDIKNLPDLIAGATLFADKRLVVIKSLSENKSIWPVFDEWLSRVADTVQLVLVEQKPDKRTKIYKALQKAATVHEYQSFTEKDTATVQKWILQEAKAMNLELNNKSVQSLIERVGFDQWSLLHALEKLSLAGEVTQEKIEELIERRPEDNVFALFDAALRGDRVVITKTLRDLELTQDPYQLFGLLSSQAFQLAAVSAAEPSDAPAKDLAIHPYVLSKLKPIAKQKGRAAIRKIITALAEVDDDMKVSRGEPWLLIERGLIKISTL